MKIPVLMYHSISDDKSSLSVSPSKFLEQMKFLRKSGYNSINFNQIYEENRKPIIITFDDGYKDNLINALPILKEYNFISTCFVVSDFIGESNKWDEKKRGYLYKELLTKKDLVEWLKHGMSIGSHGKTHKSLTKLDQKQIRSEIYNSKNEIQDYFGTAIDTFSYPFGQINKFSADVVKEIYNFGVTTVRSRFNTIKHKAHYIPRVHMSNDLTNFKIFLKLKTIYEDIKYNEKQLYM